MQLTGEAEAAKRQAIGLAEAKAAEALGLARAVGFEAQKEALGGAATAMVAVANAVAEGHITVVPEVLVTGGGGGGPIDGLAATLMRYLTNGAPAGTARGTAPAAPKDPTGPAIDARTSPAAEALDALQADQPDEIRVSDTDEQDRRRTARGHARRLASPIASAWGPRDSCHTPV